MYCTCLINILCDCMFPYCCFCLDHDRMSFWSEVVLEITTSAGTISLDNLNTKPLLEHRGDWNYSVQASWDVARVCKLENKRCEYVKDYIIIFICNGNLMVPFHNFSLLIEFIHVLVRWPIYSFSHSSNGCC